MAENDAPAWADLPSELCELVDIDHPRFPAKFRELGLKWYQFPALSRLGFDIGGVQYTAAPFIGWWVSLIRGQYL
jgi:nitric oxide synthase oxygenase domain/subunit